MIDPLSENPILHLQHLNPLGESVTIESSI